MEVLKLIAVFAAIILILRMKRPLWLALCCGALATVALYGLSPLETLRLAVPLGAQCRHIDPCEQYIPDHVPPAHDGAHGAP